MSTGYQDHALAMQRLAIGVFRHRAASTLIAMVSIGCPRLEPLLIFCSQTPMQQLQQNAS